MGKSQRITIKSLTEKAFWINYIVCHIRIISFVERIIYLKNKQPNKQESKKKKKKNIRSVILLP